MERPSLSIVMLCYRAGETVRSSVREVLGVLKREHIENFELILVANYNYSEDLTPLVVAEVANVDSRIKFSAKVKKGMFGWDMKTGFALATGNYIVVIDGDGQMPFTDIPRVYRTIRETKADMAKTYRTERGDNVWRIAVSYIYNVLFTILFPGLKARDINSKPKIFTRKAFSKLSLVSDDWFIDAEMMIQARRHRFVIKEIPTVFHPLVGRKSFIKSVTILEFLRNLVIFRIREFFIY